jgi:hypothetical protein
MQAKKLHDNEEQTYHAGQAGVFQILPFLQKAYGAQGNQVDATAA